MKEALKKLLGLLAGSIIKDIGDAFDKNFANKEEKMKALAELERVYNERLALIAEKAETDPDSWLSKNVRPILCLIGMVTISLILVFDPAINEALQKIYVGWVGSMITFYFGYREIIKRVKRRNGS